MISTADSYLLVSTQSVVGDLIKPNVKDMSEKTELLVSRVCSIVFGALAFVVAMFFTSACVAANAVLCAAVSLATYRKHPSEMVTAG